MCCRINSFRMRIVILKLSTKFAQFILKIKKVIYVSLEWIHGLF